MMAFSTPSAISVLKTAGPLGSDKIRTTEEIILSSMEARGTPVTLDQIRNFLVIVDVESSGDLVMVHYKNEAKILENSRTMDGGRKAKFINLLFIRGLIIDLVERRPLDFGYGHSIQINSSDLLYSEGENVIFPRDEQTHEQRTVKGRTGSGRRLVNFYMGFPGIVIRLYKVRGKRFFCTYRNFGLLGKQGVISPRLAMNQKVQDMVCETEPIPYPAELENNRTYYDMLSQMHDSNGLSVLNYLMGHNFEEGVGYYFHLTGKEFIRSGPVDEEILYFLDAIPYIPAAKTSEFTHEVIKRRSPLTIGGANTLLAGVDQVDFLAQNRSEVDALNLKALSDHVRLDTSLRHGTMKLDKDQNGPFIRYNHFRKEFYEACGQRVHTDYLPLSNFVVVETFVERKGRLMRGNTYEIRPTSFRVRDHILNGSGNLYSSFLGFLYNYRFSSSEMSSRTRNRRGVAYRDTVNYRKDPKDPELVHSMMKYLGGVSKRDSRGRNLNSTQYLDETYQNAKVIFSSLVPSFYDRYLEYMYSKQPCDIQLVYSFVRDLRELPVDQYVDQWGDSSRGKSLRRLVDRSEDIRGLYSKTKYPCLVPDDQGILVWRILEGGPNAFRQIFASEVPSSQYLMIREIIQFYNSQPDEVMESKMMTPPRLTRSPLPPLAPRGPSRTPLSRQDSDFPLGPLGPAPPEIRFGKPWSTRYRRR